MGNFTASCILVEMNFTKGAQVVQYFYWPYFNKTVEYLLNRCLEAHASLVGSYISIVFTSFILPHQSTLVTLTIQQNIRNRGKLLICLWVTRQVTIITINAFHLQNLFGKYQRSLQFKSLTHFSCILLYIFTKSQFSVINNNIRWYIIRNLV